MKLILCKHCQDIVRPYPKEVRKCHCGDVEVRCINELDIIVKCTEEWATPIGFKNSSFRLSVIQQPESGMGLEFVAFIIPKKSSSIIWEFR
jgi:hypothetical protein